MTYVVLYRDQPVMFKGDASDARRIADIVPRKMATLFASKEEALDRAALQFGDVALAHVSIEPAVKPA